MADLTDTQFLNTDPDVLGLQRQRKLAELLTGQAFNQPQGQMISGRYVKPSNLQQALPMISAAIGGLTNANLDTKQTELAAALRGKQQEAMQNYVKASQGSPAQMFEQQAGPMPNGGNIAQQMQAPATGPNYGEMFKAGTSQYASPQLQAAAYKLLEPITTKEGETVTQRNLGAGGGMTPISAGGVSMPAGVKEAAQLLGITKPITQWNQQELAAVNQKVVELKRAGAINFSMPPAESAYAKTFGEKLATKDIALEDAASNAQNSLDNISRQRSILKSDKVITGFGAEPRLALAQFGQAIGAGGQGIDALVSNTQGLLASRAGATLDAIKTSNLGSAQGFSNTDREFLEKAKLGGIKYTTEALNHQLDIEEKLARISVDKWNTRLKDLPKSASIPVGAQSIKITPPTNVIDYNSWK